MEAPSGHPQLKSLQLAQSFHHNGAAAQYRAPRGSLPPDTLLSYFGHYPKHTTTAGAQNKDQPTNWEYLWQYLFTTVSLLAVHTLKIQPPPYINIHDIYDTATILLNWSAGVIMLQIWILTRQISPLLHSQHIPYHTKCLFFFFYTCKLQTELYSVCVFILLDGFIAFSTYIWEPISTHRNQWGIWLLICQM